jgi:dipeptidyl aminopeptidase/acylaminoacyl peptidase
MMRSVVFGVAALLCAAGALAAEPDKAAPPPTTETAIPPRIPTSDFAVQPVLTQPKLSPDGLRLLARVSVKGKELLGIYTLANGNMKLLSMPEKGELSWYDEAQMTRMISFDLTADAATFIGKKAEGLEGDDVLYVDPDGAFLLMQLQRTIYDWPAVFRVDLATNKMDQIVKQQDQVWEWYADNSGVVRAGIGFLDKSWFMVYRKGAADKFAKVGKARYDDEKAALDLLRFNRDSDLGYVFSNEKTGRFALYRYNYATRTLGDLVYESPTNDLTSVDLSEDGTAVESISLTDERSRLVWFDAEMKKHQDDIDAALKGRQNWITSKSRDKSRMLIWTGGANDPGSYYVYQPAAGQMNRLAKINEKLSPKNLAPTRYVHYKARDGLDISAYLTLPQGRPEKGLPLVIMPHGGPFDVRDELTFDPEVQLLANRGYAVLQPNFRGSGGYGKAFYEKGEGQWGRAMQDDLDDGMDWLVKQGTVDAKRVCIVGSSYGGYAALWGVTRNPERYRCAASFAGISDLKRQLRYQTCFLVSERYRKDWRNTVKGQENTNLDALSPLKLVAGLTRPVLLAHGDEDERVPYKQSSLYAEALKKAGKSHEFYTYKGEGHGFDDSANFKDWMDRLDAFLAKHNPS